MPYPVFVSEVQLSSTDTVQSEGGSVQALPVSGYYFYFSSKSTAGNGRSLLSQLETSLTASSGVTWSAGLTSDLKLKLRHDAGGTVNAVINRGLAWNLGFAKVFGSSYPPDLSLTITIPVPTGAGGYTAEFRSPWLWCPERNINFVGPQYFDPAVAVGVPFGPGASSRAPDGSVKHINNGELYDASFTFRGVQPLYRARPSNFSYSVEAHEREDYETWWRMGPKLGMKFLFWRDKFSMYQFGFSTATAAGSIAPTYVEYHTSAEMARAPLCKATLPPSLVYHDITVSGWLTQRGVATY